MQHRRSVRFDGFRIVLSAKDEALAAALAGLKTQGAGQLVPMHSRLGLHVPDVNEWIRERIEGTGTARTFRTWQPRAVTRDMLARDCRTSVSAMLLSGRTATRP